MGSIIHSPVTVDVKGIQITGHATLITADDPEYDEVLKICNLQRIKDEIARRGLTIIKVKSKKIELLEIGLKRRGHDAHQVWEASG